MNENKDNRLRTIVVLPAYNAEKTLRRTVNEVPKGVVDGIIPVDDCSSDKTMDIARELGLEPVIGLSLNIPDKILPLSVSVSHL